MANTALLEILARLNPQIWEIIHPHVPVVVGGYRQLAAGSDVELNPQPIPPGHLVVAGAALARQVAEGAVLTQAQTSGGQDFLRRVVDDWCGTRAPRPWPPGWPHHMTEPDPHPWDVAQMFAVAAVVFAGFAAGVEEGEFRDAFRAAADKLGERAEAELNTER